MSVLDDIVAGVRTDLARREATTSLADLRAAVEPSRLLDQSKAHRLPRPIKLGPAEARDLLDAAAV